MRNIMSVLQENSKKKQDLLIDITSDARFITINNSRYYVYRMKNEIVNQAMPQDTNEINKVEWQPFNV